LARYDSMTSTECPFSQYYTAQIKDGIIAVMSACVLYNTSTGRNVYSLEMQIGANSSYVFV